MSLRGSREPLPSTWNYLPSQNFGPTHTRALHRGVEVFDGSPGLANVSSI